MGMKYKDPTTGKFKEINVKVADTLPVGSEVDYNGTTIPTGWEEVDSPNDYSTEEVKIGTWVDGKPLYRKVISSTLPKVTTEDVEARKTVSIDADIGTGFIETAYCNNYNQMLPIPFIFTGGQVIKAYIGLDGSITLSSNTTYTNEQQVIVIVCYTKTTD